MHFCSNLEIVTSIGGELWHGKAGNRVNFDFGVQFYLKGHGQMSYKTLGILTNLFWTWGPNSVILACMGDELSRKQTRDYRTQRRIHRQTQATTIPEAQNCPWVKMLCGKWPPFCLGLNVLTSGFRGLAKDNWGSLSSADSCQPGHPWSKTGSPKSFLGCLKYFDLSIKDIFIYLVINTKFVCFPFYHVLIYRELGRSSGDFGLDRPTALWVAFGDWATTYPQHCEWSTIILTTKVRLILEIWW